jgi:hypothetical protein
MYFHVPANVKTVKVKVVSEPNEPVDAALLNENNVIMAEYKEIKGGKILKAKRNDSSKNEIWSIKFTNAVEDYSFTIGAPLRSIVSESPNLLPTIKK